MDPEDLPKPVAEPPAEFTLDEWVAATQSCCGIDPPDDDSHPVPPCAT